MRDKLLILAAILGGIAVAACMVAVSARVGGIVFAAFDTILKP